MPLSLVSTSTTPTRARDHAQRRPASQDLQDGTGATALQDPGTSALHSPPRRRPLSSPSPLARCVVATQARARQAPCRKSLRTIQLMPVFDPTVLLDEYGDEALVRDLAKLLVETVPV